MRRTLLALGAGAVFLTVLPTAVAGAGPASLCEGLAAKARQVPVSRWAGGEQALAPELTIAKSETKLSASETQLVHLPAVLAAIGPIDAYPLSAEHLSGADLYMVETIQGTLDCDDPAFAIAKAGGPLSPVADPSSFANREPGDLCWNEQGDLGRVSGRPVFLEHGTLSDHTVDDDIVVTPWLGAGWGKPCRVGLRFAKIYRRTARYCGDKAVCDVADHLVTKIAAAFNQLDQDSASPPTFHFGPPAPADVAALAQQPADLTADLPTFGAALPQDQHSYGGDSPVLFPLKLGAHWYVGAIGRGGVGWRQSGSTLLTVLADRAGTLTPVASFVVAQSAGRLSQVIVDNQGFGASSAP
jgi:hypothetical protein